MSFSVTRLVMLITLLSISVQRESRAQFNELARRVPADANTLVLIDVEKAIASPAGEKGNWKDKIENAYSSGLTILPPGARRAVLASQLDLEFMTPIWQTEILELSKPTDTTTIAKQTGGTVDNLDTCAAVRLPSDAYVVHFDGPIYGVMLPANRQAVGRWISAIGKDPPFSPYLTEAYRFANDLGTPLVMAIDLHHAVPPEQMRSRLKEWWEEAGMTGKGDPIAIGKVLVSIRGVTLGLTLRDKPFGKIKIDFEEDATPLAAIAKPMFLHVLDHRGLTIDEFNDWDYEVKGKQVTLSGYFTTSGLRRIMSTFDRPSAFQGSAHQPNTATTPEEKQKQMAKATLAYFKQVDELLHDLKEEKKDSRRYTTGSIAQWCTNYSKKMNRLPLLNVDPEMITYGSNVAQTLVQAATALNTGNVQGGIAARNTTEYNTYTGTTGYGYRSNWWGGAYPVANTATFSVVDARATTAARANIKGDYRSQSTMQARQIIGSIDQGTADIRAKMVQKYQIEF